MKPVVILAIPTKLRVRAAASQAFSEVQLESRVESQSGSHRRELRLPVQHLGIKQQTDAYRNGEVQCQLK